MKRSVSFSIAGVIVARVLTCHDRVERDQVRWPYRNKGFGRQLASWDTQFWCTWNGGAERESLERVLRHKSAPYITGVPRSGAQTLCTRFSPVYDEEAEFKVCSEFVNCASCRRSQWPCFSDSHSFPCVGLEPPLHMGEPLVYPKCPHAA